MNEVRQVLAAASRRLFVIELIRALVFASTLVLAVLVLTRIAEQLVGVSFPWTAPYGGIWTWAGAAVLVGAVVWTIATRRREGAVARIVDDRAGLRESLSTALWADKHDDGWSRAVVETARERAAKVRVSEAIPFEAPRRWQVPVGLGAALAIIWFTVDPIDIFGLLKKKTEIAKQQQELVQAKEKIESNEKKLDEMLAKAKLALKDEQADNLRADEIAPQAQKPEEVQRAAIKKLTNMSDRLKDIQSGEKGDQQQAIKDAMRQLKQPGDGALNDLYRAMARGNFEKADEALKDLAQKLAEGNMTEQQKEQLKAQLDNLSKQLKKLAENQDDMEKKLEAAGLSKEAAKKLMQQAASNPDALKKALEDMKSLSPEQQEKLLNMAKAAAKSSQQCENMGESMSKMSQGMGKQGMEQQGMEGMGQLGEQLSELEMAQQEMEAMQAAQAEIEAQLSELGGECSGEGDFEGLGEMGEWKAGESNKRGSGSGGPGKGDYGGKREDNPADFALNKEKARTNTVAGPIIGSRLVYGEQIRGESQAEFSAAAEASEKAASEAIENLQVPRSLQPAVKAYFGSLVDKSKGKDTKKDEPPKPAAPDAPAKEVPKK